MNKTDTPEINKNQVFLCNDEILVIRLSQFVDLLNEGIDGKDIIIDAQNVTNLYMLPVDGGTKITLNRKDKKQ